MSGATAERIWRSRLARAHAAMAAANVDLLLLSRAANAVFVSGARRVQVAGSGGFVPWALLGRGDPAPWIYTPDPDGIPAWMTGRGRPMAWGAARLIDDLRAVITERRPGERPVVAVDAFSPAFLALFRAAFPEAIVRDAEPVLAEAREVKGADEIEALARAARVADAVVDRVATAVVPGVTPRALAGLASHVAIAAGASFLAREVGVRAAGESEPGSRVSAEEPLASGQLVSIEVAVCQGGVQGESARTVAVGAPAPAAAALLARGRESLEALAAACRASATPAELLAAVPAGCGGTPLLLHGIGTGVEPPFLDPRGSVPSWRLRAGMVLVVTTEARNARLGAVRGSRTLLVTDGAPRCLTSGPGPTP